MRKPKRRLSLWEAGEHARWSALTRSVGTYTMLGPHEWYFMRDETREMRLLLRRERMKAREEKTT